MMKVNISSLPIIIIEVTMILKNHLMMRNSYASPKAGPKLFMHAATDEKDVTTSCPDSIINIDAVKNNIM